MYKNMVITFLCLMTFGLAARAQTLPQMRITSPTDSNQIGSSGLAGVHTEVIRSSPMKRGLLAR